MKRASDFFVLAIQVALGYFLVHTAKPITDNRYIQTIAISILVLSASIVIKAFLDLGKNFAVSPQPTESSNFVSSGIYSKIRHPMYCAVLIGGLSILTAGFNSMSLFAYSLVLVFFSIKIRYEEQKLEEKYENYTEYKKSTGRIVPRIKNCKIIRPASLKSYKLSRCQKTQLKLRALKNLLAAKKF